VDLAIISDEFLLGTQVTTSEDLSLLRKLGVQGLLNLQDESDFRNLGLRWEVLQTLGRENAIDMRRVPIRDFDPADLLKKMETALLELDDLFTECKRVYVHCTAGINRSAGILLAYLVLRRGFSPDTAYHLLRSRRPQISPYRALIDELSNQHRKRFLNSTKD
jgi:protein-tyrosine phosphatase